MERHSSTELFIRYKIYKSKLMAKEEEKMELGEAIINCLPRQIKLNVTIRIYDLANLVKAAMIYTMRNIVMKNVEVILRNTF